MEEVIAEANDGPENIYISFDIDVLDSAFMPATGTPESNGLTPREVFPLICRPCAECNLVGFELVELLPYRDDGYQTMLNSDRIVRECHVGIALRKSGNTEKAFLNDLPSDDGRESDAKSPLTGSSSPSAGIPHWEIAGKSVGRIIKSVAATILVCVASLFGTAQTCASEPSLGPSTDQLLEQLEEQKLEFDSFGWPAKGRFPNRSKALQRYIDFNRRMWDDHRFSWMVAPTLMFQGGTQGGPNTQTSNYQHNMLFYWRPVENTSWGTGQFVFSFLQVRQLSSTTGIDLTKSLGVNWPISDSVADSNSLKSLYWQQDFPRDAGYLRFGHIELNGVVFSCAYACDDTQSFISAPLSSNPSSTMSGQGWGLVLGANLGTKIKFELGVADGNGDGTLQSPGSVNSKELAFAGAATFSNLFPSLGDGEIKIAHYSVDGLKQGTPGAQASTSGTVISMQQDVGEFGLFARYTEANGRQALSKNSAVIGAVWKNPFGHSEDWLGFGIGSVQPTAAGAKREVMGEAYYRMQLAPLTQLTAGVIVLDRPNNPGNTGTEAVFNIRLRAHF